MNKDHVTSAVTLEVVHAVGVVYWCVWSAVSQIRTMIRCAMNA